jgi:hypothetical protein
MNIIEQNKQKLVIQYLSLNTPLKQRRKWGIIGLVFSVFISPFSPLFVENYQLNCTRIEPTLIDCSSKNTKFLGLKKREEFYQRINQDDLLLQPVLSETKLPRNQNLNLESFFRYPEKDNLDLSWWKIAIPQSGFYPFFVIVFFLISFVILVSQDYTYSFSTTTQSLTIKKENSFGKKKVNYNFNSLEEIGYQENWYICDKNFLRQTTNSLIFICGSNIVIIDDVWFGGQKIENFLQILDKFYGFKHPDSYYVEEKCKKVIKIIDNKRNREYIFNNMEGKFYQVEITTQNKVKECPLGDIINIYPHLVVTREADEDTTEREEFSHLVLQLKNEEQITILDGVKEGAGFALNSFISSIKQFVNC